MCYYLDRIYVISYEARGMPIIVNTELYTHVFNKFKTKLQFLLYEMKFYQFIFINNEILQHITYYYKENK